jgi:hypothetical protein
MPAAPPGSTLVRPIEQDNDSLELLRPAETPGDPNPATLLRAAQAEDQSS